MRIKIKDIIEYFFVIVAIIECNTVYTRIAQFNTITTYIVYAGIFSFICMVLLNIKKIESKKIIYVIILQVLFIVLFILNYNLHTERNRFILKYIFMLPFLVLYFLQDKNNINNVLKKFVNVVFLLATISLMLYILGTVTKIIPSESVTINWGGIHSRECYLFVHFNTQKMMFMNNVFYRNTGIFTEAPMYSYILTLAVISLNLDKNSSERRKRIKLIVLVIAIITTLSATGMICVVLAIFIKMLLKNSHRGKINIIKVLIIPFLCIGVILACTYILENKQVNGADSYNVRMDDYSASIKAWKKNIFLGNGFCNDKETINNMSRFRKGNLGQSNGIGKMLAECGLYMTLIYLLPLVIDLIKSRKSRENDNFIFYLIFMILFFTTNIPYSIVTIWVTAINSAEFYNYLKIKGERNERI